MAKHLKVMSVMTRDMNLADNNLHDDQQILATIQSPLDYWEP